MRPLCSALVNRTLGVRNPVGVIAQKGEDAGQTWCLLQAKKLGKLLL